LKHDTVKAE